MDKIVCSIDGSTEEDGVLERICENCGEKFIAIEKPGYTMPVYCCQVCYNMAYIEKHGLLFPELDDMGPDDEICNCGYYAADLAAKKAARSAENYFAALEQASEDRANERDLETPGFLDL